MPKKFPPEEFEPDVVTVAPSGDLTVAEVAGDRDVSPNSVRRWMRRSDVNDGINDAVTTAEQNELVQLRPRSTGLRWRTRSSAEPLPTAPRTRSKNDVPSGPRAGRRGDPGAADCGALGFWPQGFYEWPRRPCSDGDWADAQLTNTIVDIHADDPEFAHRFIVDELACNRELLEGLPGLDEENVRRASDTKRRVASQWLRGQQAHPTMMPSGRAGNTAREARRAVYTRPPVPASRGAAERCSGLGVTRHG